MARINVEQKALTDPRFFRLGHDLGASPEHAHAVGLFAALRAWNECIERGVYGLEGWVLQAVAGHQDGAQMFVNAGLAEQNKNGVYRLKGTVGRTDYLEKLREQGRLHGKKGAKFGKLGGRPKRGERVSENGVRGFQKTGSPPFENPPPAPAPAPALNPQKESERTSSPKPTAREVATPARALSDGGDPGPDPEGFLAHATQTWADRYGGRKPPWSRADRVKLTRALAACESEDDARSAWDAFLADPDPFYAGHEPGKFLSQLSRFVAAAADREPDLTPWPEPPNRVFANDAEREAYRLEALARRRR